jgi:PKD repeat protein
MTKTMFSMLFRGAVIIPLLALLVVTSCKDDDDMPSPDPVASYQFTVSQSNFLEVTFENFSQNATSYSWNFGDGNTSTQEDPVHTFASAGTYNVVLTATNAAGKTAQHAKSIMLMDPNEALAMIAGATSKTWYLQREGVALGIGPVAGDNQWWSFGGVTPLGDRPCILDDAFTFHRDGDVDFSSNGTIFIDSDGNGGWLGAGSAEGCFEETEPGILTAATGEDLSSFANGGDYTFDFDVAAGTITVDGLGFYIGLANKLADGDNYIPQQQKVYTLVHFGAGTVADSMTLALASAAQSWNFYLVSYHNPADLPEIPTALPRADFQFTKEDFTVTFQNLSANSTSYSWNFGDGGTSTEEDPIHTYTAEGEYTVTLTVSDGLGNSDDISKTVQISSAQFTGATLSSADGKIWKLAGVQSFYVGPTAGSGEWWGGITEADLVARACQLDDEYIFHDGGMFVYDSKGAVFAEPYMLGNNDCVNDGDIVAPYGPLASGTHAFEVTEATDSEPARIKVIGEGAFIGFNKAFNGGELNGTIPPVSEITYTVFDYTSAGGTETLRIVIDISAAQDGTAWWTMVLQSQN